VWARAALAALLVGVCASVNAVEMPGAAHLGNASNHAAWPRYIPQHEPELAEMIGAKRAIGNAAIYYEGLLARSGLNRDGPISHSVRGLRFNKCVRPPGVYHSAVAGYPQTLAARIGAPNLRNLSRVVWDVWYQELFEPICYVSSRRPSGVLSKYRHIDRSVVFKWPIQAHQRRTDPRAIRNHKGVSVAQNQQQCQDYKCPCTYRKPVIWFALLKKFLGLAISFVEVVAISLIALGAAAYLGAVLGGAAIPLSAILWVLCAWVIVHVLGL
jgi:hypothetical protein